jgi:subtilisin family serine protease
MRHTSRFATVLFVALTLVCLSFVASPSQAQDTPLPGQIGAAEQSLLARAQQQGHVDVIVGLNIGFRAEGLLTEGQVSAQQTSIANAQAALISRLSAYRTTVYARYRTIPFVALKVDAAGLLALFSDPLVAGIEEDVILKPSVLRNLDLIDAEQAWVLGSGYTGAGRAVAVIDTGVQANHPEFEARVIPAAEACFSSNDTTNNQYQSTCPGGVTSKFGAGAAAPCTITGCGHGTHVAGTVAGVTTGVAPDASIIAINASTRHNSPNVCGLSAPCAILFTRDVVSALEHVYALRTTYSIASVNMSLGGTADFRKYCDTPAGVLGNSTTSYKSIFDNLVAANIAPVVAAGNAGYTDAIEIPACISSAVSVGATGEYGGNPDANVVASFSNSSQMVDLLAPGTAIYSALPGSAYGKQDGTSMAAPHVAGAWAVLKQREPSATVTRILTALQATGVSITDSRNGITRPRIDVDNALNALISNSVLARPRIVINEVTIGATAVIELYNKESSAVTLTGWSLETYTPGNALELNYTFPAFSLPAGAYVRVFEGSGTNTATTLYTGQSIGSWTSGAVSLKNDSFSIDFVRWGSSTVLPPLGSAWLGNTPAAPTGGNTLGREGTSLDRDEGADWFAQTATPGTVNNVAPPANDLPANPQVIAALPFDFTQNTTLATSTNDPALNLVPEECRTNTRSVWFSYTPSADQVVQFNTVGSDFDTLVIVWKNIGTANPSVVACDDDNGQSAHSSLLSIPITAGTAYSIQVVGGFISESGFLRLQAQVVNVPGNDSAAGAVNITQIPSTFTQSTLLATDDGPLDIFSCPSNTKSVWFRYTAPNTTPVRLDTQGSNFDTLITVWTLNSGIYTQVACNDDFYDDYTSRLDFVPNAGTTYYIMISGGIFTDSGDLVLNLSYAPPPPANDEYTGAMVVGALPWTTSMNTENALLNASDPDASCDLGFGLGIDQTVWYRYNATSARTLRLSTAGSDFSTLISVWTRQPGWVEQACADGFGGTTQVDVITTAGTSYYIMVAGTAIVKSGDLDLSVSEVGSTPLAPTLVAPGNNAQGSSTPTFTWQAVTGAVSYELQVGTGNPPVYTVTGITGTTYTASPLPAGATYRWRVRTIGAGGTPSPWSAIWVYTVTSPDAAAPLRTLYTVAKPTLTWTRVSWAASYELQFADSSAFTNPVTYVVPGGQTSKQIEQNLAHGVYYWRVRPLNANGTPGGWSATESFVVLLP